MKKYKLFYFNQSTHAVAWLDLIKLFPKEFARKIAQVYLKKNFVYPIYECLRREKNDLYLFVRECKKEGK
jgi:hypothetical protein